MAHLTGWPRFHYGTTSRDATSERRRVCSDTHQIVSEMRQTLTAGRARDACGIGTMVERSCPPDRLVMFHGPTPDTPLVSARPRSVTAA